MRESEREREVGRDITRAKQKLWRVQYGETTEKNYQDYQDETTTVRVLRHDETTKKERKDQ